MNRREAIKLAIAGAAFALNPVKALGAAFRSEMPPLTIAQIVAASWPAVLNEMRDGRTFADQRLNELEKEGRIYVSNKVGVYVEFGWGGAEAPIGELRVPMYWSKEDDARNPQEWQKVNLVATMLENLVHSHDDMLLEKAEAAPRTFVWTGCLYKLWPLQEMGKSILHRPLYTVVAFHP